ncbi:hypothetical protein CAL18_12615 [Bordetella genomosp. 7]|uniref:hypothetical protein n=1 Tax=Bordetella genomosp. 7 TaxID=1416805 RepID=UPI000B9E0852|nr:hypothetical protein [Bordetella genomosp. 7]OZI21760.1 hypothetical protein CAL18_12615 [Bordetella genomosp. 7]
MTDRYARIREALEALDAAGGGGWISWETAFVKYAKASQPDTIRALLAERDELAKDAERYRLVRRKVRIVGNDFHIVNLRPTYVAPDAAAELDAVADAAIAQQRKGE